MSDDDTGNEANGSHNPASHAPGAVKIWTEKSAHKLTSPDCDTIVPDWPKGNPISIINANYMGTWTASAIFAGFFWGTVGTGYLIYGWKQRSMIPLFAGIAMNVLIFFVQSALPMSLICIGLMVAVWWLVRQGYGQ